MTRKRSHTGGGSGGAHFCPTMKYAVVGGVGVVVGVVDSPSEGSTESKTSSITAPDHQWTK